LVSLADFRAPTFSLSVTRGDGGLEDEFELFMQLLGTYFKFVTLLVLACSASTGERYAASTSGPIVLNVRQRIQMRWLIVTVVMAWCVNVLAAMPNGADTPPAGSTLEEVLVTGERPGPGVWRASKANHELWILATLEPLPKKMIWRSAIVDTRIARSQVVLAPPGVKANIGFFRALTLVPSLLRARKSPGGETLEQSLPHDLYIRWLALRVKYLGSHDDERLRPEVAAFDLYSHAIDQSGLTSDDGVWEVVEKTAHKSHVPITPIDLNLPVDDAKGAIRALSRVDRSAEIACLAKTIERLETDLPRMRQRANFWSLGDVAGLRALPYPDEETICFEAILSVPELRDRLEHLRLQLTDAWLAAAARAIETNDSSFAVVPITELLAADGLLERLRTQGYDVQEP
jgi:uncharacterized protein YbaP (TraB family)